MPTPNYHLFQQNEKSEQVVRGTQSWNIGHGRAPLLVDEHVTDATVREKRRKRRFHLFAILSLLLVFVHYWRLSPWNVNLAGGQDSLIADVANAASFDWRTHSPSKKLNWTDCYGRFQCARLEVRSQSFHSKFCYIMIVACIRVPLLYSEPSGEKGAVALVKYPSKYPPGHKNYRGPILFNPGGPGGSGVSIVLLLADALRTIVSDEFDLVGFDPRGVGFTTPALSIFHDQVEAGKFFLKIPINLNTSRSDLAEAYAMASISGNIVADRARFVAERVSTPLVARDMLSIVKAFGQDKLQYWGFSYGTVLGATFSTMFPEHVGRVIIDGVVDTDDYYSGAWVANLRDTDAALRDIYHACVSAGPSKCPIYENSTVLVEARVNRLLDRLKNEPLAFYSNSSSYGGGYEVVDYPSVKTTIFSFLYQTHAGGAYLAEALAALERGDAAIFHKISPLSAVNDLLQCKCPAPGEVPAQYQADREALFAIGCGDILESRPEDLESVRKAYQDMAKLSSFADTWGIRVACSGWKLSAKEKFNGSFHQSTSHPLLLIGNTADPVTPLWSAHKVSKNFKDSVVLTQNSSGHCSVAATSICTFNTIRKYFINGTLPEKGTVCETESSIFGEKELNAEALSVEDKELMYASEMIQKNYFVPALGGSPTRPF